MKETIYTYFLAEKLEAFWIFVVGVIMFAISIYLFFQSSPNFKFMAIPIFLLSLIELVVGGTVYFRTEKQISSLVSTYETSKKDFIEVETKRMNLVMKSFNTYKIIEISFILSSFFALIYSIPKQIEWLNGFAVGLGIQSVFFLIIDFFAEPRGAFYLDAIQILGKELNH